MLPCTLKTVKNPPGFETLSHLNREPLRAPSSGPPPGGEMQAQWLFPPTNSPQRFRVYTGAYLGG
ncbi:hypothetical protein BGZ63DRAFT_377340 [Mariannaea sp. PMI_226]|nr:hypothetical protein BGZ63DRAFT_377340 [Mariannaea sp. PMI_226]